MANRCFNELLGPQTSQTAKMHEATIQLFWYENPVFYQILQTSHHLEEARERTYNYLEKIERKYYNNRSHLHQLDYALAFQAIKVLKTCFSKRSEETADFSALELIFQQAQGRPQYSSIAFWKDFHHLFLAMKCKTGLYQTDFPSVQRQQTDYVTAQKQHADFPGDILKRSIKLDQTALQVNEQINSIRSGLQPALSQQREENKQRILKILGATEEDWYNWQWQCRNVITDGDTLGKLVSLRPEEILAVQQAKQIGIPFGITPYYVSLMDHTIEGRADSPIRLQVIPPLSYVQGVSQVLKNPDNSLDFMGEQWTSPTELVTRRYPNIAIFKPYNTCAQICVYCQRNWEINDVLDSKALASKTARQKALQWFKDHPGVNEILITGGDPAVMTDLKLQECLEFVSSIKQISRIRIGTRTPVVLPMRITEEWVSMLASYKIPGIREIVVMTHFQHPLEITPDSVRAVQLLRSKGIAVYNQGVFTYQNCRRYELTALRRTLRLIGVDPYYTFNAKGKKESEAYRVPIARLLQEQAEEARLTPGLDRCDEAVFNIPKLGKNYLRNGLDHQVNMILPDGSRVYEFFPWDRQSRDISPYLHTDPPIHRFLERLADDGIDPDDYDSIWYYY